VSINRRKDKDVVVYMHHGILFSHKKEQNLAICKNTDGSREYDAKQNKPIRERQIPYDLTHAWNLRKKTNEHGAKERQTK